MSVCFALLAGLIGAVAWFTLPPMGLLAMVALMLPAYAATWLVPYLQSRHRGNQTLRAEDEAAQK